MYSFREWHVCGVGDNRREGGTCDLGAGARSAGGASQKRASGANGEEEFEQEAVIAGGREGGTAREC